MESKLEPFFHSEEIIAGEELNQPIMKIVGKSFQNIVLDDNENNYLVYYHSSKCEHCHKAGLLFEKLAELLITSGQNKNLKFGKFNVDKNDYKSFYVHGLPTLRLFQVDKKDKYVDYPLDKKRTLLTVAKFSLFSLILW